MTNDVHTHDRGRQPLQDVLACVRLNTTVEKAGRRLMPNAERTLKGAEEMARLWADFPEGLENAVAVAEACAFRLDAIRGEHPLPAVLATVREAGSTAPSARAPSPRPSAHLEPFDSAQDRLRAAESKGPPLRAGEGEGEGQAHPSPCKAEGRGAVSRFSPSPWKGRGPFDSGARCRAASRLRSGCADGGGWS